MVVFNLQLFGEDAEWFCKLSKEQKIDWIKKNTNQQNDAVIEDFLSRPLKNGDCGCGCGGNKNVSDGKNIGSGDAPQNAELIEDNPATGDGLRRNLKRGK